MRSGRPFTPTTFDAPDAAAQCSTTVSLSFLQISLPIEAKHLNYWNLSKHVQRTCQFLLQNVLREMQILIFLKISAFFT